MKSRRAIRVRRFNLNGALFLGLRAVGLFLILSTRPGAPGSCAADLNSATPLRAGEFIWEPQRSPTGPVVLVISLPEQSLHVYRNGVRIARSSISSGVAGRRTPTGTFTILEKEVTHFSSKYNHAPMPYMQRLTWQGVAMHAGYLPGYPASHGCIRLPPEFARQLYDITRRGMTVIVTNAPTASPDLTSHASSVFSVSRAPAASYDWHPERSRSGPVFILVSGADRRVLVYRNRILIGTATLSIRDRSKPLGNRSLTLLEGSADQPSAWVPGKRAHRWMAVTTDAPRNVVTMNDLARRVKVSQEFASRVYDLMTPGTTLVVTDDPGQIPGAKRNTLEMTSAKATR